MKKVVCFGGGNAVPKLILPELKKRNLDIVSVTSATDSGGSTGQLRQDFGIISPGDLRRHLIALSEAPQWKKDLFAFRFGHEVFEGGHVGHGFGNAFIGGLEYILKDYDKVLEITHEFLEVKGKCYPVTTGHAMLVTELENGTVIFNEDEVDVPKKHNPTLKIVKSTLKPEVEVYPPVAKAVAEADLIIIGPGDMYSSLSACLLPKGLKEAFRKSKAKKVYVCPAMAKLGESHWLSVVGQAKVIEDYIGCPLDKVIFNTLPPTGEQIIEHQKKEPLHLGMVLFDDVPKGDKYVGLPLLKKGNGIDYDPVLLAKVIFEEKL
jgi:uncharacterized cofD-like protein